MIQNLIPCPCKVQKLWQLVGKVPKKGEMECDAWGLRKFMSHFVKRFKQVHRPRETRFTFIHVCMHACVHQVLRNVHRAEVKS